MGSFKERRTLHEYPTGGYRWTLLLLTVLSVVLASYEFQLAPVLPLLLPFLHMTQTRLRLFRLGGAADFGSLGVHRRPTGRSLWTRDDHRRMPRDHDRDGVFEPVHRRDQIVHRRFASTMAVVAGMMAGAGAALVRDMSPRLSRALAFGLLTIGPVGSNFLATYIAGRHAADLRKLAIADVDHGLSRRSRCTCRS